ncbi:Formate/nitrite transporter-domain-containing protein [Scheffersomyces amazonensis]|uniref:Formate/nitrite transporter-domain-containing protein n=1 Tax=Scheffersomyces amazonensis TaxID=1078765 RepID=UPI00315D92B9
MVDESLYLTTHETALAVVATAMKKSRLRLDTLFLNSFIGGILFTSGGMLYVMIHSYCPQLVAQNPGVVNLLQGLMYPIGLFYVVIMGVDLFNSNVLFFSTALARNAVSILDVFISWMVSYWGNLVGTIFVCYVICNYSGISKEQDFIEGSVSIIMTKCSFTFVENLIKGIAGNFFVCLAIYLQLMAKPLHVKLIVMGLPIFTFVSMGFTHCIADMYMLVIGLINRAPVSVGVVAWKVMLPGAIGNIIGGSFFGVVITWYLHLVVVERDQRELNLPRYEVRDEQPELNIDSRVVRQPIPEAEEEAEILNEKEELENEMLDYSTHSHTPNSAELNPRALYGDEAIRISNELDRAISRLSTASRVSVRTLNRHKSKSPKNVFPVYGMGPPSRRESKIASGIDDDEEDIDEVMERDNISLDSNSIVMDRTPSATYIGDQLKKVLSRKKSNAKVKDLENQYARNRKMSLRRLSTSSVRSRFRSRNSVAEWNSRLERANISPRAAAAADNVAGVDHFAPHYRSASYRPDYNPRGMNRTISTNSDIGVSPRDMRNTGTDTPLDSEFNVESFDPETDLGVPDDDKTVNNDEKKSPRS